MTHIAIQGINGSFHSEAAARLKPDAQLLECKTFQEVFEAVSSGKSEYGVVAIENSLHGSINVVYRLLERHKLWIAGETTLHIEQCLIGPATIPVATLNTPEATIFSQGPALAQCELWFDANLPLAGRQETHDTADSVRMVVAEGNPLHVAVAGKYAANMYGGTIISSPINDDPHNYTRFVLLQKEPVEAADANRTSIILTTDHSPSALYNALGAFAEHGINLSKLDSHPIPADTRHYAFYIDLEAAAHSPAVQEAFEKLTAMNCTVKVLGSYRVTE